MLLKKLKKNKSLKRIKKRQKLFFNNQDAELLNYKFDSYFKA